MEDGENIVHLDIFNVAPALRKASDIYAFKAHDFCTNRKCLQVWL
jgi:hypothetical protein